jgi:bifunctional oligoribonuclease and PAP phosphatase NrnA
MKSIRIRRVAEQIHEEISGLITKGLKDPRLGFVTITGVEVSPDLGSAWVFFSCPGTEQERSRSLKGLESSAGFIRKTLGRRLHLRTIPEFHFKYDESLDRGDNIERLLVEVRDKEGWDDPSRQRGSAEDVIRAIGEAEKFLVTSHFNPDGDAIASVLAMRSILLAMGKQVVAYNEDPVPRLYTFLPGSQAFVANPGDGPYDATLVLDCGELDRCGPLPPAPARGKLICIDHHLTTSPLGEAFYIDPGASSIGEMIDRMLPSLPVELNLEIANCIYCSVLTDTGSFRYSNTTPAALRSAARMVEAGVEPWEMSVKVYESQPLARIRLLAEVLQTLWLDPLGRYGSVLVTKAMLDDHGASMDMIDGFINYPRSIEGVQVAIQFREAEQGRYKVSFRSRGRVNVAEIASSFGGGGHRNAAGCTLEGSVDEVSQQVYDAVEVALGDLSTATPSQ